jgi:hypothetical protein
MIVVSIIGVLQVSQLYVNILYMSVEYWLSALTFPG